MKNKPLIGVLPFGRPTFDVPYAEEKLAGMLAGLRSRDVRLVGPDTLLMDGDAAAAALASLVSEGVDQIVVLQVTFTDAVMIAKVGAATSVPLSIWAPREPRTGGRLRLNAFCGLNLAAHALGLRDRPFSWLHADPDEPGLAARLDALLSGARAVEIRHAVPTDAAPDAAARNVVEAITGSRIARIGAHPDGFDTCAYDGDKLRQLAGITVDAMDIDELFAAGRTIPADEIATLRADLSERISGADTVNGEQLDKSLALKLALDRFRASGDYSAFAIRCWPETFTQYGGAVCGPVAMQGEARVPCACEADVYGALSSLILQKVADAPVFLADLVDLDPSDDTGVVWHCGQAPLSMRGEASASATIHSNRKMPLLFEFPLKPGRITVFRISQARGRTSVVIGGGEMIERPLAFSGTAGVVRFDAGVDRTAKTLMDFGFEHHMAVAYGDHRQTLRGVAAALDLPVLELDA